MTLYQALHQKSSLHTQNLESAFSVHSKIWKDSQGSPNIWGKSPVWKKECKTTTTQRHIGKKHNNKYWKDLEKFEPSYTGGRIFKWCSYFGTVWLFLNILYIVSIWASKSILMYKTNRNETYVNAKTCTCIFTAALFTAAKSWNNSVIHQL